MNKLHDHELEWFKRSVDLVDFAKRAGYEQRPHDGAPGLTVLDHPNRDRIVVAQSPTGPWIYASVPDYVPRAAGEPSEQALARLRHSIDRTVDRGTLVEFVRQRDPLARGGEVSLDHVRERLRTFRATGLPLDFDGGLCPPPYPRGRERSADRAGHPEAPGSARQPGAPHPELNRRRYDWTPVPPGMPRETEVEQRLRKWREAQSTVDVKIRQAGEITKGRATAPAVAPAPTTPSASGKTAPDPDPNRVEPPKSELNRRRYDWTPAPVGIDAITKAARNRSPDRGR